jgi:hypothetical protein
MIIFFSNLPWLSLVIFNLKGVARLRLGGKTAFSLVRQPYSFELFFSFLGNPAGRERKTASLSFFTDRLGLGRSKT